jgi:hypothetical protein
VPELDLYITTACRLDKYRACLKQAILDKRLVHNDMRDVAHEELCFIIRKNPSRAIGYSVIFEFILFFGVLNMKAQKGPSCEESKYGNKIERIEGEEKRSYCEDDSKKNRKTYSPPYNRVYHKWGICGFE